MGSIGTDVKGRRVPIPINAAVGMETVQVKKIIAVCFLEAARMTLDHLGSHRMALADHYVEGADELPKLYGDVRRLRDYLQRCVAAYPDVIELDLMREDRALLVFCCRRFVEAIDVRLAGPEVTDAKERQFLRKKQQVIADWTLELSEKPLIELPLPRLSDGIGEGTRALKLRLHQKLFPVAEQSLISQGRMRRLGGTALPGADDDSPVADTVQVGNLTAAERTAEAADDRPVPFVTPRRPQKEPNPPLLDGAAVQDPRLRSLVTMDLRSLELAESGRDHRMATVLMATILEAAILDYAIPRRGELGLVGGPDTWNSQELLFKILGSGASPSDRSSAYNLFCSRNLLSPAQQMITPMVVTSASAEAHRRFVGSMLHQLGFGRGTLPGPAGPPAAQPAGPTPAQPADSPTKRPPQ